MSGYERRGGFVLIEMMVTALIFLFIIAAIYVVSLMSDSTSQTGLTYIEISQDARLGIDRMVKELHQALSSTVNGATALLCNNVGSIQFSPTPFSGKVVSVAITVEKTSPSRRNMSATLNNRIRLRN